MYGAHVEHFVHRTQGVNPGARTSKDGCHKERPGTIDGQTDKEETVAVDSGVMVAADLSIERAIVQNLHPFLNVSGLSWRIVRHGDQRQRDLGKQTRVVMPRGIHSNFTRVLLHHISGITTTRRLGRINKGQRRHTSSYLNIYSVRLQRNGHSSSSTFEPLEAISLGGTTSTLCGPRWLCVCCEPLGIMEERKLVHVPVGTKKKSDHVLKSNIARGDHNFFESRRRVWKFWKWNNYQDSAAEVRIG
ncbi:hypothetical protein C8F04DRAFT_1199243 [Mycena alexandri]|uniref:Uncharacterized protein n=1 Tax=Mycena alexandri TaxID=1745969 RepID=A0AAD6RZS6_9AGAR|nr:hypothetical protein C8F04DRAFT_1199243 [Mycena alexandri]